MQRKESVKQIDLVWAIGGKVLAKIDSSRDIDLKKCRNKAEMN